MRGTTALTLTWIIVGLSQECFFERLGKYGVEVFGID